MRSVYHIEETPLEAGNVSVLIVPILLALLNWGYALYYNAGGWVAFWVTLYFLLPVIVLFAGQGKRDTPDWWDAFVIASMALIPILAGKRFGGQVDLPYIAISAALEGWWLWNYCRGITGLSFQLPKFWHLALVISVTAVLCLVLMPIAHTIGFPKPLPKLKEAHGFVEVAGLIWDFLQTPGFGFLLVKKVLQTAVVEELLYRGLVLNMLQKKLGSSWCGMLTANLVSSALFGISHYGHGGLPYVLLSFVAGVGFGAIYQVTKNLTPSSLGHGVIDTITRALYEMKPV